MTLSQRQRVFTSNVAKLITWTFEQGYEVVLLEAERTVAQQRLYVEQGKSQTIRSQHLKRLAVDLALFVEGVYQQGSNAYAPLGRYWKSLHEDNAWGGDWVRLKDGNHFEMSGS